MVFHFTVNNEQSVSRSSATTDCLILICDKPFEKKLEPAIHEEQQIPQINTHIGRSINERSMIAFYFKILYCSLRDQRQ